VLYNAKKGKQSHIFNASKKTVTCLAFAGDGKHLVSGEVCAPFSLIRLICMVFFNQELIPYHYSTCCSEKPKPPSFQIGLG